MRFFAENPNVCDNRHSALHGPPNNNKREIESCAE